MAALYPATPPQAGSRTNRSAGMTMIKSTVAIIVAFICLVAPAVADDETPDSDHGRYSFSKVADGLLRLDLKTGEVSLCSQRAVGWACQAAPDDRTVLENEIARLRTENAALKQELITHNLSLPDGLAAEPPASGNDADAPKVGDKAGDKTGDDIDRMVEAAGRLWRRFVDAIARAQRQVLNNKS
jgi:hypothetical protein